MKFVDQTRIFVKSGDGGNGIVSFRREAYVEYGGPNGGDGGRGGDVVVRAVDGLNTLVDYRYTRHFKARPGGHGMGSNMTGASGAPLVLEVPAGTQIFDEDQEFQIADLLKVGDEVVLAKGGDGGLGNTHFKTSTNRAPRKATPGHKGEEHWVILRLKLIADAGLLGLPNAGKSTFLSATTRAKPKIADYPFTTIKPQLGVVGFDKHEFVLADIPGLIEGASDGVGLGTRFLGHIERCRILLHLIDGLEDDIVGAYETIMGELEGYGGGLVDKPMIVGINKADGIPDEIMDEKIAALKQVCDHPILPLSGATGMGVREVLSTLWGVIKETRQADAEAEGDGLEDASGFDEDGWGDTAGDTAGEPSSDDNSGGWSPI